MTLSYQRQLSVKLAISGAQVLQVWYYRNEKHQNFTPPSYTTRPARPAHKLALQLLRFTAIHVRPRVDTGNETTPPRRSKPSQVKAS